MFSITDSPIDAARVLADCRTDASGALATFEGIVRNHNDGRPVERLEYECYKAMAMAEGGRILEEAAARFDIHRAVCTHRVGALAIGDAAVLVGVSSAHRAAAFEACQYIIDEVKRRVPIWKKEHYTDAEPQWIDPAAVSDPPS